MQDIFVTTLSQPLPGWQQAFTDCQCVREVSTTANQAQLVFWLHMNEDRQHWMQGAIKRITTLYPNAKVVVLANAPDQAEALYALSLGAVGYSHAYATAEALAEIKTVIAHGGLWLGNTLLQKLIEVSTRMTTSHNSHVNSLLNQLTQREKEVAVEAAKGLSNKEIARILNITDRTVKAHLASIFEQLKVKDRLHLALILNQNYQI
ncbi:helix-turn-helix transcriptional regulator [Methylotenera sp. N17]|uniref:helix-turn-helix transcriptional regulator n=1 Tax=Methylotenera sp. N17 TaxID=1502761 RepID=UPI000646A23F|nr:response regulator transcription factor [Methylotenera sp. N17]